MTPQWRYQPKSQEVGKTNCPVCPSSDGFHVYEDGHAHCYSCGHHVHSPETIEKLKSSIVKNKNNKASVWLPDDYDVNFFPEEAAAWLNKYRLTEQEKRKNKIGYSEKYESLIFPVFGSSSGDLLIYQRRYFGTEEGIPKWKTFGNVEATIHLPFEWTHDRIVFVEDIISAIKVSRVTNCMPIFGNDLSLDRMRRLCKMFKRGRMWLDPNMNKKSITTALKLSEMGMPTTVILSEKDPKEYGTADIRELVQ